MARHPAGGRINTRFELSTYKFIEELANNQSIGLSSVVDILVRRAIQDSYKSGLSFFLIQKLKEKQVDDATPELISAILNEIKAEIPFMSIVLTGLLPER